jgi:hypothetical protein
MAAFDQTHANAVLDASLTVGAASGTALQSVFPIHVRYMTANGSATANGTELASSGGYAAGTGAPTVQFAAASAESKASSTTVTTTNMPPATLVGVELWDSAGTPARKLFGALTASKTTNSGDTFSITAGSLTAALT